MRRLVISALLLAFGTSPAWAQAEQQATVDRATLAVQEVLSAPEHANDAIALLRQARAVMVCPRVFRAGFIFGGQGGDCVLAARDGGGSWSSPAFYGLNAGSVGFQIGIQDGMVIMMILTDQGLNAVLDSQFKVGATASVAVAHIGAGIDGATTAAVGADIVTFARNRGLFAGISLEGTMLSARSDWNRAYYGRDVGPRQVVIGMEAHNPGSDPLRAALMRYGAPEASAAVAPLAAAPPPATAPRAGTPAPAGRIQQESLQAPPRR